MDATPQQTPPDPAQGPSASPARRPRVISLRAVCLGLLGVLFICGLTPFNDYAMANTYLVGNFLPVGVLVFLLVLLFVVNAPLRVWLPRRALRNGEMAVILGMMLVSCALPSSGLMRFLPATTVGLHYKAGNSSENFSLLKQANLPNWILPKADVDTLEGRVHDPVIGQYWHRAPVEESSVASHVHATPWSRWVRPALAWALLLVGVYGGILCMSVIVRHQWAENERLPFPLASVYTSLIEAPAPGKPLNALFSARTFWFGAGLVFAIHSLNALHAYLPKYVPQLPVTYNLTDLFSSAPWSYCNTWIKTATLYFSMVGIAFFLQTKIAFSLWVFFILLQVSLMVMGSVGYDFSSAMQGDQTFGSLIVFTGMIAWVARHHWAMVLRHMIGLRRENESTGRYLPYALAGWGFVLCAALVAGWLMAAGVSFAGALVIVLMLFTLMLVIARVVAETGLIFAQIPVAMHRPWHYLLTWFPSSIRTTNTSFFFTAWIDAIFCDEREALSVYATHAMVVADRTTYEGERTWRRTAGFIAVLVLALAAGYVISGASTLYVEYAHAQTLAHDAGTVNPHGIDGVPNGLYARAKDYFPPNRGPQETHSQIGHFTFGAALTGFLAAMRLRFAWWPLHPVGFLLVFTWPLQKIWLSLLVGWLLKVLLVKFGGAKLYANSRAFFIGLIVGEAGAAGFWLLTSLLVYATGGTYRAVNLLPV